MDRVQVAVDTFRQGYNCAQSVFSSLAAGSGHDREQALRTASCFGAGMRCGEVCGAVSGALMAIGLLHGYDRADDAASRSGANAMACTFLAEFRARNGTLLCRELLGDDPGTPEGQARLRERGLFSTFCPRMVADAVEISQRILRSEDATTPE